MRASGAIRPSAEPLITWAEQPLLMIRRICIAFLQGLLEQQDDGCFRWHESLEDTEIVITDESVIGVEVVGKRPAISVVRGPGAYGQTSMDEKLSENTLTGQRNHTDLFRTSMSFNCLSRVDLESEYIAWVVANHIWILRRLLMKEPMIHDIGRGIQIGSTTPAGAIVSGDTEGEWINTVVTVPVFLQIFGMIKPMSGAGNHDGNTATDGSGTFNFVGNVETAILRKINVALKVRGHLVRPTGVLNSTEVNAPRIRGKVVRDIAFEQSLSVVSEKES